MINSYKDLTLEKYIELYSIDITSMEEFDIQATMIAILADMTVDEVLDLPISEYRKLAMQMQFLKEPPKTRKHCSRIKIDGKEYVVLEKVEDMTAGQYIDYETYLQQNDIKMLPYILSCLIIPKGEKYGDSDTSNELMQLSVEEALSIANFFMKRSQSLIRGTLLSLEWMMKKKVKKMKDETMKAEMEKAVKEIHSLQNIIKNGDGFLALTQYLKR